MVISTSHHLNLYRLWTCDPALCEFIFASTLFCLEDNFLGAIHHLWLLPYPLLHKSLTLERRSLMKASPLALSGPETLPAHFPVVGHCVSANLLQNQASLVIAE